MERVLVSKVYGARFGVEDDAFVLSGTTVPGTYEDIVRLVVPELQRRGLFRKEYTGNTLREHLGLARPGNFFAAHPEQIERAVDGGQVPLLLAVSDNGPQMRSHSTREFLAGVHIAQHFGRPHTPTDQAWIETLFGHVKGEWPHLEKIVDPGDLEAELDHVREQYNSVRLHASIGYVTPDDEHEGRGDAIRKARRDGLDQARQERLDHHRRSRGQ